MSELLRNAWTGWLNHSKTGQLGGVLLLTLLVIWMLRLGREKQRDLIIYATVMTILCIFPFSAVLFMLWQTKFYDPQWIWTIVPVMGLIACGGVLILEWIWNGAWSCRQKGLATVMILCLLLLSGRLSSLGGEVRDLNHERSEIAAVLREIHPEGEGIICLWAPKEVIAQARSIDPEIELLYGRNMWQEHLNAYSYDTYDQDRRDLYVWMVMIGRYGKLDVPVATDIDVVGERLKPGTQLKGLAMVKKALNLGVDKILLPGITSEESLEQLRGELSANIKKVGEYWLVTIPEGVFWDEGSDEP